MDQAEASGKTVEDAYRAALAKLNASEEDVEMVILDEGHRANLFGRGSRDAIVRVQRIGTGDSDVSDDDEPVADAPSPDNDSPQDRVPSSRPRNTVSTAPRRARPAARTSHLDEAEPKLRDDDFLRTPGTGRPVGTTGALPAAPRGRAPSARPPRGPADGPPPDRETAPRRASDAPPAAPHPRRHRDVDVVADINAEEVDLAAHALDDVLRILDIGAEISIREPLTAGQGLGSVRAIVDISGEDLGVLIGRRGDTLSSLQHLVNLIVSKRLPDAAGVSIDVEHYRHRREEQLSALAERMADRVRRTGSPITLEPMTASDRRIIHLALADDADVQTYSIGEGEARKVVISSRQ